MVNAIKAKNKRSPNRVLAFLLLQGLLVIGWSKPACAEGYFTGFKRIYVDSKAFGAFPVSVWYPTSRQSEVKRLGPFVMDIALAAPVATGRFPLVMISHGSGGTNMAHRDTASTLAQAGFIVAAPLHPRNNYQDNSAEASLQNWQNRPRHISVAVEMILKEPGFAEHIDQENIAIIGHSIGGYTALNLLGATADTGMLSTHCQKHFKRDQVFCGAGSGSVTSNQSASTIPNQAIAGVADSRFKAAVLLAPIGAIFPEQQALKKLKQSVVLYRAEKDDVLRFPYHAEHLGRALGRGADYRTVRNAGHYSFIAPFPVSLEKEVGPVAKDPVGFDRAAFHERLNKEILAFMQKSLKREP